MSEDLNADAENAGVTDAMAQMIADAAPAAHDYSELDDSPPVGLVDPAALSVLYDLSLPVTIELGRARMAVQELLALGRGSVIQLDRNAGEPIDVFVGDRRFAEGEVVVVGEQFAVRITRLLGVSKSNSGADA